jgi:hypothetical protein
MVECDMLTDLDLPRQSSARIAGRKFVPGVSDHGIARGSRSSALADRRRVPRRRMDKRIGRAAR